MQTFHLSGIFIMTLDNSTSKSLVKVVFVFPRRKQHARRPYNFFHCIPALQCLVDRLINCLILRYFSDAVSTAEIIRCRMRLEDGYEW
jgi:hypothetical protein